MWSPSGGIFKGRRLKSPPAGVVRVTQERIRKSAFDIIGERVKGADVLDLFCGSGSFGIEALSRGASSVTFVDKSFRSLKAVEENISILGIADKIRIIRGDVMMVLGRFSSGFKYNMVFLDPPYHTDLAKKTLLKLSECDILFPQVLLLVEHYKKIILPDRINRLIRSRREPYGDTILSFYFYEK